MMNQDQKRNDKTQGLFDDADIIHAYTADDAIEDGLYRTVVGHPFKGRRLCLTPGADEVLGFDRLAHKATDPITYSARLSAMLNVLAVNPRIARPTHDHYDIKFIFPNVEPVTLRVGSYQREVVICLPCED